MLGYFKTEIKYLLVFAAGLLVRAGGAPSICDCWVDTVVAAAVVFFVLGLFAGGGASESYTVSLHVFIM